MARIRLIHWKPAEAASRIEILRKAGHQVSYDEHCSPKVIRAGAPEAVVIDLTRMPSHGREVAISLRGMKATRHVPIVFAGGEADKVATIRRVLPDANYTAWEDVDRSVKKVLANPPADCVVPPQIMNRYGDRSVSQKLGIKPDTLITAIDPPRNFPDLLGILPEGVTFSEDERNPGSVTLWFIADAASYQAFVGKRRGIARRSKLWIVWPKGEAGKRAGVTQNIVRETALEVGLVDYKICSVDQKWSGMLFAAGKNG